MNESGSGDLPVQVRTAGDKDACASVHGLAMQFLGKIRDFAVSQELPSYSNYYDLKEGGQIFAQYGPAGRQLVEITMPEGGAPLKEQLDMFGPSDLPDTIIEGGCDCKHVVISCGEMDWESVAEIRGRSGRKYEAMEGNYPQSYSLNIPAQPVSHYPIGKGDSPKISDVAGACAVYQNPGPKWGINSAYFFCVCEDEKDDKENRYRPVMLPRKCKACYYWELESPLGDCDGQIYEGTDVPCGLSIGIIGREEVEYRVAHKKSKQMLMSESEEVSSNSGELMNDVDPDGTPHAPGSDLTGTSLMTTLSENAAPVEAVIRRLEYDPTATDMSRLRGTKGSAVGIGDHLFAQSGYRAYLDLDCSEPDGTFVWYVPPKNEPRSRCEDTQTLKLYCASDDELIQSVEMTIVYNRETWKFHAMWVTNEFDDNWTADKNETDTSYPVCRTVVRSQVAAAEFNHHKNHEGYVYATDSDGAVHHIAMVGGYLCKGSPFGTDFSYRGNLAPSGTAYWWTETACGTGSKSFPMDWGLSKKDLVTYERTGFLCSSTNLGALAYPALGNSAYHTYPPIGTDHVQGKYFSYSEESRNGNQACAYASDIDCLPAGEAFTRATCNGSWALGEETGIFVSSYTWTYQYHEWNWSGGSYDFSDGGTVTDVSDPHTVYKNQTAAQAGQFWLNWETTTDGVTEQAVDTSIFAYGMRNLKMPAFMAAARTWFAEGMEDDKPCE